MLLGNSRNGDPIVILESLQENLKTIAKFAREAGAMYKGKLMIRLPNEEKELLLHESALRWMLISKQCELFIGIPAVIKIRGSDGRIRTVLYATIKETRVFVATFRRGRNRSPNFYLRLAIHKTRYSNGEWIIHPRSHLAVLKKYKIASIEPLE